VFHVPFHTTMYVLLDNLSTLKQSRTTTEGQYVSCMGVGGEKEKQNSAINQALRMDTKNFLLHYLAAAVDATASLYLAQS
jgi:hypothetical protein